jgi:hypothetical protein
VPGHAFYLHIAHCGTRDCSVFRFAIWSVGDKLLFAALADEDRGVPILLMLGTADGDIA